MANANDWYKAQMGKLRAARNNSCEQCGSINQLEWAHIKPTGLSGMGRGRNARIADIKRNPDCYKLLCRKCHAALDGFTYQED
ncbi:MAG: hypothetical protein QXL94_00255 [Candidatus Parvarchaeum sp.]